jgi:hypothetical protein
MFVVLLCREQEGRELEERGREDRSHREGNPYVPLSLGVGFIVATVLVILTAGTPAAGLPFVIAGAALLGKGLSELRGQRRALPAPVSKERELLSAIRDNGGSITPAEAALETSLTVREADQMLSELAASGHLTVESHNGALFYALPGRSIQEIDD